MSRIRSALMALIAATAMLGSTAVFAHPKLVASTPAANAVVASPASIKLSFSEKLMPKLSGAELVMTKMPGMEMPPMKIAVKVTPSTDGKSLLLTPVKPLSTGTYRVDWRIVSGNTHAVKGELVFGVK